MLINVKMPTVVGILTFMSRINFVLSLVEHEKSFITSWPSHSFGAPISALMESLSKKKNQRHYLSGLVH